MATFTCPVCNAVVPVEVDLEAPADNAARRELDERVELRYATCPKCGQRNPATVAENRRDERNIAILTYGVIAGVCVGGYFVPWIAIGFLGA